MQKDKNYFQGKNEQKATLMKLNFFSESINKVPHKWNLSEIKLFSCDSDQSNVERYKILVED